MVYLKTIKSIKRLYKVKLYEYSPTNIVVSVWRQYLNGEQFRKGYKIRNEDGFYMSGYIQFNNYTEAKKFYNSIKTIKDIKMFISTYDHYLPKNFEY